MSRRRILAARAARDFLPPVAPARESAPARSVGFGQPLAAAILIAIAAWLGCAGSHSDRANPTAERVVVSDGWLAMGTFFEADLRVVPALVPEARAWLEWARTEIERLERIYSRHSPESELSALNRTLTRGDVLTNEIRIGADLEAMLFDAVEVWETSGGAFDITIGPLVDVWTRAAERGAWPSLEVLRHAKRRVGSGRLLLPGDRRLDVTARDMRLDLDGLSKGAVLDRLAERLRARLPDAAALLSFGQSSVMAIGDPEPGRGFFRRPGGWRLEIRSRGVAEEMLGIVRLVDRALSVSSSVGSVSQIGGEIVSHVVDPRTGNALDGTVEAVVVGPRATIADGWSTALLVLGAERSAVDRAEKAGLEAIVFESYGRTTFSDGWDALTTAATDRRQPASAE